ncbi:IclR family transcriptional regulator [Microbacterium sp. RD1]|uniref:IclR family transcriptional regulator n=1 Tax=Microbacterium sp. RD1 TaxID=3457313 RepID=UPI003FA5708A
MSIVSLEDASAGDSRSMIGRVAAILRACDPTGAGIGISELARRTELPKSSVARIVGELVEHRLLERDGSGVRLGIRMFELGESVSRPRDLRRAALPTMADLRSTLNLTIHLAVLECSEVVYIEVLRAREAPPLRSRVGGRLPAHSTAVGKALLAWSPDSIVDEALARPLTPLSPVTITSPADLRRELGAVRDSGVAWDHEESRVGISAVAAAVLGPDGTPVLAISAAGWSADVVPDRVVPAVRAAGAGLARLLGRHPRLLAPSAGRSAS